MCHDKEGCVNVARKPTDQTRAVIAKLLRPRLSLRSRRPRPFLSFTTPTRQASASAVVMVAIAVWAPT